MLKIFRKALDWLLNGKMAEPVPAISIILVTDIVLSVWLVVFETPLVGFWYNFLFVIIAALILFFIIAWLYLVLCYLLLIPIGLIGLIDALVQSYVGPLPKWYILCFFLIIPGSFSLFYFSSSELLLAFLLFIAVNYINLLVLSLWTRKRLKKAKREALVAHGA